MYMYTQDIPVLYNVPVHACYKLWNGKVFFPMPLHFKDLKSKIGIYNSKRGNHKNIAVTGI